MQHVEDFKQQPVRGENGLRLPQRRACVATNDDDNIGGDQPQHRHPRPPKAMGYPYGCLYDVPASGGFINDVRTGAGGITLLGTYINAVFINHNSADTGWGS